MSAFPDYGDFDGLGLAELARTGKVSPLELVDEAIARIEAQNPRINAVIFKLYDSARAAAAGPLTGPFAGVPFLLKDLTAPLAGTPMSQGNKALRAINSSYDATIVTRQKAAGLVLIGKTNVPEFGLAPVTEPAAFGPARNPWNLERTPGGSSGGSAAAVAARIAPMAHGSDGGGSIRIPASCCGLFGLKPTRGRTPPGPRVGERWRGFSIGHAITRSVRDSAALLDATAGAETGAPYDIAGPSRPFLAEVGAPTGKLRIAYTKAPFLARTIRPDCIEGLERTVKLLAGLGHELIEATPPFDPEPWLLAFMTIIAAETQADIEEACEHAGRRLGPRDFEAATFAIGQLGKSWSAAAYARASIYLQAWAHAMGAFFEHHDILLTPTLAEPPTLIGALQPSAAESALLKAVGALRAGWFLRSTGLVRTLATKTLEFIPYTPLFNVTGQPAMSVPLHWSNDGLPIGMQFATRFGDEAMLFRLAAQLEAAQPWFNKTPAGV